MIFLWVRIGIRLLGTVRSARCWRFKGIGGSGRGVQQSWPKLQTVSLDQLKGDLRSLSREKGLPHLARMHSKRGCAGLLGALGITLSADSPRKSVDSPRYCHYNNYYTTFYWLVSLFSRERMLECDFKWYFNSDRHLTKFSAWLLSPRPTFQLQ